MSLLKLNMKEFKEPQPVMDGEYELILQGVSLRASEKGGKYLNAVLSIVAEGNAPLLYHIMSLPDGGEYDDIRGLSIRRFCETFGIEEPEEGFSLDAEGNMIGVKNLRARALVSTKESEYGVKNVVKRWLKG